MSTDNLTIKEMLDHLTTILLAAEAERGEIAEKEAAAGVQYNDKEETMAEAVNPLRRQERAEMKTMGFKTKKAYRKWRKKERRKLKKIMDAAYAKIEGAEDAPGNS